MVDVPVAGTDPKYGAEALAQLSRSRKDSGGPAYVRFRLCGDGGIYTLLPGLRRLALSVSKEIRSGGQVWIRPP